MAKCVLLVNDDPETGSIWAHALRQRQLDVDLVGTSAEAFAARKLNVYDLIIINVDTPQLDGIGLVKELRTEGIVPILLFAYRSDEEYLLEAYKAGVDEYVCKPVGPRLFLAKVTAWLRRSWTVSADALDALRVGPVRLDGKKREVVAPSGQAIKLSNLEFRVLHFLMSHYGQVVETAVLVERVWGYTESEGANLLKNVIYRLRQKLEPDPGHPRYIRQTAGGYMFKTGTTAVLRLTSSPQG
jgi:two-component system, OmpR family, KDP operon response regulator KdpE